LARKLGQLIARGQNTWLVRIYQGRDPETGTRKYLNQTIHGPFRDAQRFLNLKLQQRDLNRTPRAAAITLNRFLDQWLAMSAKPRLRARTFHDYESLLRLYIRPVLGTRLGEAKSYAERLFDFPEIGPLSPPDARAAIVRPAENEGAQIEDEAVNLIITKTQGYPYFLQEWGKHTWDIAPVSPIRREDVVSASDEAIAALDESFFRVRFDRLTPMEKKYLRAMADLGPGPHRSGDIADELERTVQSLGPIRAGLIAKGMIWSPTHGDTAFTVPLFDEFMKRIMPGNEWKTIGN
jgi:hypothetical protein